MSDLSSEKPKNLSVTGKVLSKLRRKVKATGLPPRRLLEKHDNAPEPIDTVFIVDVLSGGMKKIRADIYDYLIDICNDEIKAQRQAEADQKARIEKRKQEVLALRKKQVPPPVIYRDESRDGYETISEEKRKRLAIEYRRTNLYISQLLKIHHIDHISAHQISQVMRGVQKTALMKDVDLVLKLYASMPSVLRFIQLRLPETALDFVGSDIKKAVLKARQEGKQSMNTEQSKKK